MRPTSAEDDARACMKWARRFLRYHAKITVQERRRAVRQWLIDIKKDYSEERVEELMRALGRIGGRKAAEAREKADARRKKEKDKKRQHKLF